MRRLVIGSLLLLVAGVAFGATRDVDTKRFARVARLLLTPEEAALLKELRDDKDRLEFQRIFWARRDPSPGTPANEYQENVLVAWARADELFSAAGQKGAESGCGQVFALLGRPEEVRGKDESARSSFDSLAYIREGAQRAPETWVFRDRPGRPFAFTGAELRIDLDADCRYAEGAGLVAEDLRRAAAVFVTRPDLGYTRGADGHLVPLAAETTSIVTGAGARALLASPRSDFPLAVEAKLVVRAPSGEAYVAGVVSAPAAPGSAPQRLSLAAQATDAGGQPAASAARDVVAPVGADGLAVASWSLGLKPGRYTVAVAASLTDGKGSVTRLELDVPDLGGAALACPALVLYPDEPQRAGRTDPTDAYAAFQLGGQLLRPRFGNVFTTADALMVVAPAYGAKPDPATGQASFKARYSILKDGRPVARGAEDTFTTVDAVASVGPIPLAGYTPGAYVVRLDLTDVVTKQTLRREAPLEIRK